MKRIITLLSLCLVLAAQAQNFQGSVYYKKASGATEALPFAQIYILEKSKLIEADENGKFSLNISDKTTLIATYVGYTKDTVVVEPGTPSADFYLSGENDLSESVVTAKQAGLSKLKPVRTEVITSAGLCKMACCALAESFENSASVTVGFSDAVTGARQIKLLGLSGTYTQMLDENRPVMRGLASPFGLSFVPGQWLESIQIAKGPSSVINGLEAITGQINMEHRKPTDETPLFIQIFGSSDQMYELNAASAIQYNERWSGINLFHIGGNASKMDHNHDGFRDDPANLQINFNTRWLYYDPSGMQIRFGLRYINDDRLGGQMKATRDNLSNLTNGVWGSNILNQGWNPYFKIGVPLNEDNSSNIALVVDYNYHTFDSFFGKKNFYGNQHSAFANLIYQNELSEMHKMEFGLTAQFDNINQKYQTLSTIGSYHDTDLSRRELATSAFGEYTFTLEDKLTFVGGLNLQYSTAHGLLFAPRANVKYSPVDWFVVRALGGRGYRSANIITDNLGVMSTGSHFVFADNLDLLEDAWTFGGNLTFYLPFGAEEDNTYLSFDYFHNNFNKQVIVDQEYSGFTGFYNINRANGDKSYTNTFQVDFSVDPIERFNITATFRYTDARVTLQGKGLVERPMTSRFKGVLNLQYSTPMSKWIFDFTAQLNGPVVLPETAAIAYGMKQSPIYPMFYAQVTRKFRGIDVYVGGENLSNFRQHEAIIDWENPFSQNFNASFVWGPLMGWKVYAGLRYTLWK